MGRWSGGHFIVNMLVDDTLVVVDPLGSASIKERSRKHIKDILQIAGLKKAILVNTRLQFDQDQEQSCGPLSVAIAEKLTQLGYAKIKTWIDSFPNDEKSKNTCDPSMSEQDITNLLKTPISSQGQTDHLVTLMQKLEDTVRYKNCIDAIRAEHKERKAPKQDEISAVQQVFPAWLFVRHTDHSSDSDLELLHTIQRLRDAIAIPSSNSISNSSQTFFATSPSSSGAMLSTDLALFQ